MPKLSPTDIVDKQIKNTQNAKTAYIIGIKNPDRDPKQAAIAAEEKMKDKWNAAVESGAWKAGVEGYDLQEAQRVAEKIGADNLVRGVAERRPKLAKFWNGFAPLLEQHKQSIQALPQDTEEQRKQRMLDNLDGMKGLKGKWR